MNFRNLVFFWKFLLLSSVKSIKAVPFRCYSTNFTAMEIQSESNIANWLMVFKRYGMYGLCVHFFCGYTSIPSNCIRRWNQSYKNVKALAIEGFVHGCFCFKKHKRVHGVSIDFCAHYQCILRTCCSHLKWMCCQIAYKYCILLLTFEMYVLPNCL